MSSIISYLLIGFVSIFSIVFFLRLLKMVSSIRKKEREIIALYKEKIDKVPAFIEIMSKHTTHKDIFLELTHLHKIAIISNISSIYDLLENNGRIHREFLFLMKVSARVQGLHKNGNFLYIRDFIIFYENTISKELLFLNSDIERYNELLHKKNLTIIGLLFPLNKVMKTNI